MSLPDELWYSSLSSLTPAGFDIFATQRAWSTALAYLSPKLNCQAPSAEVAQAIVCLQQVQRTDALLRVTLDMLDAHFDLVRQDFNKYFASWQADPTSVQAIKVISAAWHWLTHWRKPLEHIGAGSKELDAFDTRFAGLLADHLPPSFDQLLYQTLQALLDSKDLLQTQSQGRQLLSALHAMRLMRRFQPILFRFIRDQIAFKIRRDGAGQWSDPELDPTLAWLNKAVLPWLTLLLYPDHREIFPSLELSEPYRESLEHHVYNCLSMLRIEELFDIIVEYPTSLPALEDLKRCLPRTENRMNLVKALRAANLKRLLHPGADTKDILEQYVSTIRSLRVIDPQGVLLTRVSDNIRSYLRARDDTIRCIMTALIEDGGDLVGEMEREGASTLGSVTNDAEDYTEPNWVPDPLDAPPDFHLNRTDDIIQMLVSIYDTKDVFIKEFQVLLARSLLAIKDYNAERQLRNVEILKRRFGEAALQGCEIMLRDLADSKRSNQSVHTVAEQNPVHPTILSRLFWPNLQSVPVKLPMKMAAVLTTYQAAFAKLKPDRKLRWLPQLGTVDIEIELDDRTLQLEVTPVQAAVAELFQEKPSWTFGDLSARLEVEESNLVRNALYFWSNAGVVKENNDRSWQVLERVGQSPEAAMRKELAKKLKVIDEGPSPVEAAQQKTAEELRVFWQFIRGMLTNLGALPSDRIYSMLSKFVPDFGGKTVDDLEAFLELMKKEGVVEKAGNKTWKLV